jgi:DNA repair ATPase RecN
MENFEFKRKEDLDNLSNLSKVPVILVKIDNLCEKINSLEARFTTELEKISLRLEKVESLRERLAEVEVITTNHDCSIKELHKEYNKQVQNNVDFLKKVTIQFVFMIIGLLVNILFTLLKK